MPGKHRVSSWLYISADKYVPRSFSLSALHKNAFPAPEHVFTVAKLSTLFTILSPLIMKEICQFFVAFEKNIFWIFFSTSRYAR